MSSPAISVLIPVLNEERYIAETARAALAQEFDGEIEFLFVDGRSNDRTRPMLEELARADSRIRVLDNPARKTPVALNIGLRAARGEYVARMDAHSWYPPNYLASGVARLKRGDADWVAGPQVAQPSGGWSDVLALALGSPLGQGPSRRWRAAGDTDGEQREVEYDLDTGVFCGVWRRDLMLGYGGWNEEWHANQDSELAARFLADGRRIVCLTSMAADYAPRDTLTAIAKQYFRFGRYRAKTSRRHPDTLRPQNLAPPALVPVALLSLIGPRPVTRAARIGWTGYMATLGATMLAMRRAPAKPAHLLALPLVLALMHLCWGAGFWFDSVRHGLPLDAIRRALGGGSSPAS